METILPYLTLVIAAATLVVTILLALRLKTVHYLLQQPVVKKMSPQLRLKPVRLDEAMDRNRNRDNRGEGRGERREGRPEGDRNRGERGGERNENRGERREGRPEGDRNRGERGGERNENRGERREGRPEGDRNRGERGGERNENRGERREGRPEGDRNRGERREGRPEGDRNRDNRSESQETFAPAAAAEAPAGLPPRRPLNTFNEGASETAAPAPARDQADATFVGGGDDVQHGRRTQLKKKPRFDFDESETPASV